MTQENAGAGAVLGAASAVTGGMAGVAFGALKAADAVMDRVTQGFGGGGGTQKFHVEKDTVLQAGKVVHEQWILLSKAYDRCAGKLRIVTTDGKVTSDVVTAWNDRLVFNPDSYAKRIRAYMTVLESLSDQLKASAEQYGLSEDDIKATFKPKA
ncbi:hypothetical protein [Lentzea sp. NBRC 102530]|uniref:hypothetical protein n=1 Tax=Lentzea sp. NBRC 102530 TaxID=3032201 RepID=UPI0024A411B2|nr:hypothetical protein [Lentzea sp. NBRC 102530]GLY48497.1 hypothetical protein Lesp01_21530 [Lentzea sp. NBRC 102530]